MSRKIAGTAIATSTMRIMIASSTPPVKPDTAPQSAPKLVATTATAKEISSALWPPTMSLPRRSKPFESVPSGWPLPGGRFVSWTFA